MRKFRDLSLLGALKRGSGALLRRGFRKFEAIGRGAGREARPAREVRSCTLIEQSHVPIHVFAPDGTTLLANGAWNEFWNLGEGETAEGTNIFEDDQLRAAGLTAYVEESIANGIVLTTPSLWYDPMRTGRKGEPRWLKGFVYPAEDDAGRVLEIALEVEDVTEAEDIAERKRAEKALKESEERFRALTDATFEAIVIIEEGKVLDVNKAYAEMFGCEHTEIVGRSALEVVAPESTDLVSRNILSGHEEPYEAVGLRRDGTRFDMEIRGRQFLYRGHDVRVTAIRDVTERKKAETELRKNRASLAEAQRIARLGSWEWDVRTDEHSWSDEVYRICGYEPGAFVPTFEKLLMEVVHPDDRGLLRAVADGALYEDKPHDYEHRIVRPDGEVRVVHCRSEVVLDEEGEPLRMTGTVHDISERKRVEEILKESEAQNKAILDASPDLMFLLDRNGEVLDLKAAGKEIKLYVPPEEIVGKRLGDLLPAETADTFLRCIARALDMGETQVCEYRLPVPEGVRDFEARLVKSGANEVLSIVRDVTERKRSEELLRQQSAAMTASMDGVAILDESGAYTYVNDAHAETFGYDDPGELLGKSWKVLYDGGEAERLESDVERALREDGRWRGEAVGKRRDGSTFPQEVSLTLIEGGGTVCVVRDIAERKRAEEKLKESEERYRAVVEQTADGIYLVDPDSKRILATNASMQRMFGYGSDEFDGMEIYDLVASSREEVDRNLRLALEERRRFVGERKYRCKDGTLLDTEIGVSVISYENREVVCAVVRDVTERKLTEARLRESEERFRSAFEDAPIGVAMVGPDGRYLRVNQALCEMLGYSEEEMLEKTSLEIIHPEDQETSEDHMRRALEDEIGSYALERRYVHADGPTVRNLTSVSLIRDSRGKPSHFVCLHQDVTERKALEERLEHQAFHDSLTGLANRALFVDRLEHALARLDRRREPIAVLFADLDNFKVVNDSLGHEVGDRLLVKVAGRLKECVRPEDTVARFGGDEFVILLEGIADLNGAIRVADRIVEALKTPFEVEGREVFIGTSVGIGLADETPENPGDLVRNADLALYTAKDKGRDRYEVFDASMGTEALERLETESALRKALERGEFEIYYQPKLSMDDGKIVSLEALVRWEHPERGLLEPDEFLPVAEESGLIVQIGEWVLDEVCQQGRKWQERFAEYSHPRVCTNISPRQFLQTDLVGKVTETLQRSGLKAQSLSLEIAEGILMDDAEANVEKLTALNDLGIHIVIDDFGTAYSSLAQLKNFPLNILKIDRSLTVKLDEGPENEAIVSAMIQLAQALGWAVTAQGVENEEQLTLLRKMGCDIVQGYYFTRPVTSEEATALLEANLKRKANIEA